MVIQSRRQGSFQFRELGGQFLVLRQRLAHLHEGANYKNTDLNSARTVQQIGYHDCTMFGEGDREFAATATPF